MHDEETHDTDRSLSFFFIVREVKAIYHPTLDELGLKEKSYNKNSKYKLMKRKCDQEKLN